VTPVHYLRAANILLFLIGTFATGWFERLAIGSGDLFSFDAFSVWVASPHFLLLIPAVVVQTNKGQLLLLAFAFLMVTGSLYAYYDTIFHSRGSTAGLIFLFLPLWQLLIVIAIDIGVLVARSRSSAANSALLTDTYTSPLRAQRGAAKRER